MKVNIFCSIGFWIFLYLFAVLGVGWDYNKKEVYMLCSFAIVFLWFGVGFFYCLFYNENKRSEERAENLKKLEDYIGNYKNE